MPVVPSNFKRPSGMLFVSEESAVSFGAEGKRFVLQELLGSGSFGSVYRCSLELDEPDDRQPTEYAVKVIDANRLASIIGYPLQLVCPRLQREVEILQLFDSHPHILRLHFAFFSEASSKFYLVTEYVRGGDLFNYIVRQGRPFAESEARLMFHQIVDAVAHCHRQGVAHRDLKLENILIHIPQTGASPIVKVCDYGQAKVMNFDGISDTAQTLTTTPAYTAPEVKQAVDVARPYDAFKADVYGLGVVLFGMLCNALPDAARGLGQVRQKKWASLSEQARNLIQALLNADPDKRLGASDILCHPWMQSTPVSGVGVSRRPSSENGLRAGADCSLIINKSELETVLSGQELVAAVQRERGAACWALASDEGESQLHWRVKYTGERFTEVQKLISELTDLSTNSEMVWKNFTESLKQVTKASVSLRRKTLILVKQREDTLNQEEDFWEVFDGYTTIIAQMISSMTSLVNRLVGSPAFSSREVRLRWLQCSAEQVGRERAFLCGHLDRPETLRLSAVVMELSKIVGARQVLLGSKSVSGQRDTVVSSEMGLLATMGLTEEPIIDVEDLERLEMAEMQVLKAKRGDAPAAAEAYHLLTEIIDKIHQHLMVLLVESFSLSFTNPSESPSRHSLSSANSK